MDHRVLKPKFEQLFRLVMFTCLFFPAAGRAQADSLEDRYWELYDLMFKYQYSNPDSSYYYATLLLELSTKHNDSIWIASAYEGQGYAHFYRDEMEKALEKFHLQKEIFKDVASDVDMGLAYMNIANAQGGQALYEQSIQNYLRAQRLLPEKEEYDIDRAYLNFNLAHTFLDFEDFEHAEQYLKLANKYARAKKLEDLYPAIVNFEAEILIHENKLKKAVEFADSALVMSRQQNDLIEEIYSLELMARAEAELGDLDKALLLQKESLRLAGIYGDPSLEVTAVAALSDIFLKAGQKERALELAKKAYSLKQGQRSLLALKQISSSYAKALEANAKHQQALELYKEYMVYQDSLNSIDLNESVLESQNEVFAKTNQLLEDKAGLQKQIISRNRTIVGILVIGLILCAGAIVVSVISIKRKNQTHRRLQLKQAQLDEKTRELAQANENLEVLNKGKDKLLSILTHDIKQPFNQTLSALEIFKLYTSENEELESVLKEVRNSVENDKKTVDNLLIWCKSQFARISARPAAVNSREIIERLQAELRPSLEEKKITLDLNMDPQARVYADPYHMEIILRNLLTNALKFSHSGGILELTSQRSNGHVEISVKDQGVGMSEQQLSSLFNLEKHFSEKGTLNEAGTGLGMLIVFDFVKENNGNIEVESEPSKGSIFRLKFPAA